MKPRIAIVPGDPSGIGPELIAKLLHDDGVKEAADILLVGDSHLWQRGAAQADLELALNTIDPDSVSTFTDVAHIEMQTIDPDDVKLAEITRAGGFTSLRCLDKALDLALEGLVDAVMFAPFNKAAMTAAGLNAEDEHKYMARYIGWDAYHSEINVLDELMTTRVTSHIALKNVAEHIDQEGVLKAAKLAHQTLVKSGVSNPRIGIAALNPHAGDNGKFGTEEITTLIPAVELCQKHQINATGPWPSDTVFLKAVDNVSLQIQTGESFGLVGESGSGKSTLARLIAGLYQPKSGEIDIFGHDVLQRNQKAKTSLIRRKMQMIFQDPYSSLNSRMTVEDIISEPIRFHRSTLNSNETSKVVNDLISFVGMPMTALKKYPHEFSGGQRQRISIARALASRPEILICDEPTSALDVSVQANILNLLKDLQEELSLTMLFISHDLPVIRQMCDRVAVMQNGKICEIAETDTLFDDPQHEYSKHLLGLMPRMDLFRL